MRGPHDAMPLDFDNQNPDLSDDDEWWGQQDKELEQEELERIEQQADMEELRHNGYWD
jgi:hypothetical protein